MVDDEVLDWVRQVVLADGAFVTNRN
jgi:hypothetical protein